MVTRHKAGSKYSGGTKDTPHPANKKGTGIIRIYRAVSPQRAREVLGDNSKTRTYQVPDMKEHRERGVTSTSMK